MSSLKSIFSKAIKEGSLKKVLALTIMVASLAYLAHLLAGNAREVKKALASVSFFDLAYGVLAALVMYLLKAYYHVLLTERISGKDRLVAAVMPAYCTSQVVRYLPGKIWGVLYQATRLTGVVTANEVIVANMIQTLTTMLLGNLLIISILAATYLESSLPLCLIVLALILTEIAHRVPRLERKLLAVINKFLSRKSEFAFDVMPQKWLGTLLLSLEWCAFFSIWILVAGADGGVIYAIQVGTLYAAASLFAIVAIAIPSGLAVREAFFVGLAALASANPAELLGYAVILRVLLTFAEIICVPVSIGISEIVKRRGR